MCREAWREQCEGRGNVRNLGELCGCVYGWWRLVQGEKHSRMTIYELYSDTISDTCAPESTLV